MDRLIRTENIKGNIDKNIDGKDVFELLVLLVVAVWLISPIPEVTVVITLLFAKLGLGEIGLKEILLITTIAIILGLVVQKAGIDQKIKREISRRTGVELETLDFEEKVRKRLGISEN